VTRLLRVDRVLFPGGGANITSSGYQRAAKVFYDLAIEVRKRVKCDQLQVSGLFIIYCLWLFQANERGDYFPVWGTCLGYEQLTVLTSGKDLLSLTNTSGVPLPLNFLHGTDTLLGTRLVVTGTSLRVFLKISHSIILKIFYTFI